VVLTIEVHYSGLCRGGPDWEAEVYEGRVEAVSNVGYPLQGRWDLGVIRYKLNCKSLASHGLKALNRIRSELSKHLGGDLHVADWTGHGPGALRLPS